MTIDRVVHVGVAALALLGLAEGAHAKPPVGGSTPMSASKTIVQNAEDARDESTFVAAIKAAGLVQTLEGPGPFTVFAPTDEAFKKLPPGTVDNLLKPENKPQLQAVLTYHVVPGDLTTKDMMEKIKAGGGKAMLKTVQGEELTFEAKGKGIVILDAKGDVARVTASNLKQSNGIVQLVDTVLLP